MKLLVLLFTCFACVVSEKTEDQRQLRVGSGFSNFIDGLLGRNKNCPPEGFGALETFDIESYISKSWYAVKQIPVAYQQLENFYCVRADYIKDTRKCLFCRKRLKVQVYNQARKGSVTGKVGGTPYSAANPPKKGFFRAFQSDPENNPAKITVGFLSSVNPSSNYWVVAAGTYADAIAGNRVPTTNNYDWAIVTGGSADQQTKSGKCIPKPGLANFFGMWMFARDGVPPTGVMDGIDRIASTMGLDNTAWSFVNQAGCVFS